jgi:hypothetical protein
VWTFRLYRVEQAGMEKVHVLQRRQKDVLQVWGLGQGFAGLADLQ